MTTTRIFLAALALASAVPTFASDTAADRQATSSTTAANTRRSPTTTDEARAAAAKQTEHRTTCTCTHG